MRTNVTGTFNIFDACHERNIHVMYFGTGCIYHYDDKICPLDNYCQHNSNNNGKGFKETDDPNFSGSFYSKTKVNVLNFK